MYGLRFPNLYYHTFLFQQSFIVKLQVKDTREWNEDGKNNTARESFTRSTAKLWNHAPTNIKEAITTTITSSMSLTYYSG